MKLREFWLYEDTENNREWTEQSPFDSEKAIHVQEVSPEREAAIDKMHSALMNTKASLVNEFGWQRYLVNFEEIELALRIWRKVTE